MNKSTKPQDPMPGGAYSPRIRGRIWINVGDRGCFGIGKIRLLEGIRDYGSIRRAADAMGMSYKRAWNLVQAMNRIAGEAVVIKGAGGRGGGGARITDRGEKAIDDYRKLESRLADFLRHESKRLEDD